MKRLIVASLLAVTACAASANQMVVREGHHPAADRLTNFGTANSEIFTVTGNAHGTEDGGIELTYTFLHPMAALEFTFLSSGYPVLAVSAKTADREFGESADAFVYAGVPSYWWAGAENGNLTSFTVHTTKNQWNADSSDDVLNVLAIRGIVNAEGTVPEPGTAALISIALLGMGVAARRRRKS